MHRRARDSEGSARLRTRRHMVQLPAIIQMSCTIICSRNTEQNGATMRCRPTAGIEEVSAPRFRPSACRITGRCAGEHRCPMSTARSSSSAPSDSVARPTRRRFPEGARRRRRIVLMPSVFAACNDDDTSPGPADGARVDAQSVDRRRHPQLRLRARAARGGVLHGRRRVRGVRRHAPPSSRKSSTDLRNHEVIHREFLKAVLGSNAIRRLVAQHDDGRVDDREHARRSSRTPRCSRTSASPRTTARASISQDATNLLVAGKIVSVEARHAAAIRDMRERSVAGTPADTRFAGDDVVNAQGLDVKLEPGAVLARVAAPDRRDRQPSRSARSPTRRGDGRRVRRRRRP